MSIFEQMNNRIAETKRKKAERHKKREANESVSNSESSSDKEEDLEDRPSTSSSSEEGDSMEREDMPSQPDSVEDPELPPAFQIRRPITRLASKVPTGPIAEAKVKTFKKKTAGASNSRKRPRG